MWRQWVYSEDMNTTSSQNSAHRTDIRWTKTKGKRFDVNGQHYISEYMNPWNGWAIRKHFGTGLKDGAWYVFNADGDIVTQAHSLTWAKADASLEMEASA